MKITRADFLRNIFSISGPAVVAAAAVSLGHLLLKKKSSNYPINRVLKDDVSVRLIRPPGSLKEKEFLASCIRCYRCQDACDVGAIQFFNEAEGKLFHTPYIDPSVKACNLCMNCTKHCPTNAITPLEPASRAKVKMATVELKKDLCLSHKAKTIRREQALLMDLGSSPTESEALDERRGPCGECYMFCPLREQAIKLEPGSFLAPEVYKDACVGCGMCEEICRVLVRGEPAIRVVPTREST